MNEVTYSQVVNRIKQKNFNVSKLKKTVQQKID